MARVLPVIRELAGRLPVPISIDTRKATVAAAALDAGAVIVNDVWGLRGDPEMAEVIAAHPGTGVVAMHNQHGTDYGDLLEDVCLGLRESLAVAEKAGIPPSQVIIDPGFGFAKTPAHNLELMRRLGELLGLGHAVLIGPSRKSTTGMLIGETRPGAPPRAEPRAGGARRCRPALTWFASTTSPRRCARCAPPTPWCAGRPTRCETCRFPARPGDRRRRRHRHRVGGAGQQPRPSRPEPGSPPRARSPRAA